MIDLAGLAPELRPFVSLEPWPAISGPLLELRNWEKEARRAGLDPVIHANRLYGRAKWRADMSWALGEWSTYVLEHVFGHRPAALARIYDRLGSTDDKALPAGLGLLTRVVWLSEGYRHHTEWPRLLRLLHDSGQNLMTSTEEAALHDLPAQVQAYRGFACDPSDIEARLIGPSWTLARDAAEHFARRWQTAGRVSYVASTTISKQDIAAYLQLDGWEEIVIHPGAELGSLTITPNGSKAHLRN